MQLGKGEKKRMQSSVAQRTVFYNATFHTMEGEFDTHASMSVQDGVIVAFDEMPDRLVRRAVQRACRMVRPSGSLRTRKSEDADARHSAKVRTRWVNLNGAHAYPALIDAHAHVLSTIALSSISTHVCSFGKDCVEPHNLAGVEQVIRRAASDNESPLLVFDNYIAAVMDEGRLPNRYELDEWISPAPAPAPADAGEAVFSDDAPHRSAQIEREAWVLNMDGHSSACSTALLKALGLEDVAPDGILSGPAHDANLGLISDHIAHAVDAKLLGNGIAAFCDECARYGVGTVCALEGTDDSPHDVSALLFARLAQGFPIDIRIFPQYMDEKKIRRIGRFMREPRVGGCMKWELDGSVGSRTAAFDEPFEDGSQGCLYYETDELRRRVADFDSRGFMVTAHAIGEQAIDQIVGIYENLVSTEEAGGSVMRVSERTGEESMPALSALQSRTFRHRIDHCEFPREETVSRLIELKPFITVQPGYAWVDARYMRGYEGWLGEERVRRQIPLRTLTENGVVICGSSDAPVQSIDPFLQMRGMREFFVEQESLSAYEALKTYTANGGKMLGERKGVLKIGYEASFFTSDENLLAIPSARLEDFSARSLYMRGKLYRPMRRGLAAIAQVLAAKRQLL